MVGDVFGWCYDGVCMGGMILGAGLEYSERERNSTGFPTL